MKDVCKIYLLFHVESLFPTQDSKWRYVTLFIPQGPPFTIFNDRGFRQRFIFYTQKDYNFRICLPKKITTFFSIPKKIPWSFFHHPQKSVLFLQPKKILASFIDPPPKNFWPKFQTQKNHWTPPLPLKYVSGLPGIHPPHCLIYKKLSTSI